ncbi:MAG: ATP-dependent RecD-like DNA helicase [Oscillospiraceae bacterium]|nr:ATP-dependent RecD-like DNA helicase [Oscillospiraceae bacterium]MCL2278219.1 ATP-dependent RecD-like DNA helicase [Oscillospiraceae bacterium]
MDSMIEGVVSNIVFSNAENGYTVLRLDTIDGVITAAGSLPGVSQGERLLLTGSFITHPQYGEQFKVEAMEIKPPSGADDVFRYLASGAVKNIGPAKARDIVDKFGAEALNIIENDPDKLTEVKGISLRSARKIGDSYRRIAGLRRLIDFLSRYNIKPLIATAVYKDYGDDALEAVKENPYIIASEAYGAEFFEADAIAIDMGFESDNPQRVSSAIIYSLIHNLDNGHTFIPRDKLTPAVSQMIGVDGEIVSEALEALSEYGDVVIEYIAGIDGCYLTSIFEAENEVANRLLDMMKQSKEQHNPLSPNPETLKKIKKVEKTQTIKYSELQIEAIAMAETVGAMALTGGPGTGKTTTVRGILMLFDAMGLKTALCAPTGRAAKRLSELTGREALTIHRLLGANLDESRKPAFDHDESNPITADAVIVDESSMIDILLMHSLLSAMKRGSKLVMVGDADQLPSVGPGNMFADVIRSGVIPVAKLTEIFRQATDSGIVKCAHSVNNGIMPDLAEKHPDLFFMRRTTEEDLANTVAELYGERLPKNMGIDPSQIQVLSPTRKRASGTTSLNALLRETLNPKSPVKREKQVGDHVFRTGDKVMQIRNNYDILWESHDGLLSGTGVFNGDVGVIKDIDADKEIVIVDYEDKLVTYIFDQLQELEPAFAMTVHKSQGSEYHAVILAMTSAAPMLLTRSVLYTAMTRAKNLLIIVGNPKIMHTMVENGKRRKRYSGLRARLAGDG